MRIPLYQVDAFTRRPFAGNPAAVCPLQSWLPDDLLQAIAAENNLSETAYFVPEGDGFRLRWFTPAIEVDLCGHATLASAHVILSILDPRRDAVSFHTKSGMLTVRRGGDDRLAMDFPARPPAPCDAPPGLADALGAAPDAVLRSRDLVAVFADADRVRGLTPDLAAIAALPDFAVIATAPGPKAGTEDECDFVSRFFAPRHGVPEDPVTGSAHATLTPYWAARLGKTSLFARQLSARGGDLWCEDRGARVTIAGHAVLVLEGALTLPG